MVTVSSGARGELSDAAYSLLTSMGAPRTARASIKTLSALTVRANRSTLAWRIGELASIGATDP